MENKKENIFKKYNYSLIVLYYIVCLVIYYYISLYREPVITVHSVIDDYIPFLEIFIIPYVIWYLYLFGAFVMFLFVSKKEFLQFCIYTFVGMTISYIIFFIWPNSIDFRENLAELGRSNIFTKMVGIIYTIDTNPHNVCPSLHCYNAIVISMSVSKSGSLSKKKWMVWGSWILTILICLATMFIKQHSIIDVFFAIVLAAVVYPITYCIKWGFAKEKTAVLA